jgi:hypothetical protein
VCLVLKLIEVYCAKIRPRLKPVHLKTIDSFFWFFGNQFGSLNLKKNQIKSNQRVKVVFKTYFKNWNMWF